MSTLPKDRKYDMDCIKLAKQSSKEICNKMDEDYKYTLLHNFERIKSIIMPALNNLKNYTEPILKNFKEKNKISHREYKTLYTLYMKHCMFIVDWNTNKNSPIAFMHVGKPRFGYIEYTEKSNNNTTTIIDNRGVPYQRSLTYSNEWKNSKSKTQREIYEIRTNMDTCLNKYNKYLDAIREVLLTYDFNLDSIVEKAIQAKATKYEKKLVNYFKSNSRDIL